MMMNIFSIFDPTNYLMSMNMISTLMLILIMLKKSTKSINMMKILKNLKKKTMIMKMKKKMIKTNILNMSMMILMIMNISSMLNMSFSMTSQMKNNLMFSSMWLAHMTFNIFKKSNSIMKHLIPMNTPKLLIPLICLIELISMIMRPLTLILRLTINMMAGHIMMNLMSKLNMKMKTSILMTMIITLMELMMCFIQAYVFNMLINSYMMEI